MNIIQNETLKRNPSNVRLRLKLYPYLLRSKTASTIFPHAIQVGDDRSICYLSVEFLDRLRMSIR
jgi:hypothetical protein